MKHFRKILATTDLSPESLSAVQYAVHLAKAQGAKLTILHVVETTSIAYTDLASPLLLSDLHKEIAAGARKKLEKWIKAHCKDVVTHPVVLDGLVHDRICKTADDIGASLIVMATHGRTGLGRILLGSVTERVLREAPCPVLVVRPPVEKARKRKAA